MVRKQCTCTRVCLYHTKMQTLAASPPVLPTAWPPCLCRTAQRLQPKPIHTLAVVQLTTNCVNWIWRHQCHARCRLHVSRDGRSLLLPPPPTDVTAGPASRHSTQMLSVHVSSELSPYHSSSQHSQLMGAASWSQVLDHAGAAGSCRSKLVLKPHARMQRSMPVHAGPWMQQQKQMLSWCVQLCVCDVHNCSCHNTTCTAYTPCVP